MADLLTLSVPGTLGTNVGSGSDGVLVGTIASTAPTKGYLVTQAQACLCIVDDGGAYTDDTTDANDADADDVALLPATPAVGDAAYFGHATKTFAQIDLNVGTAGAGTWTVTVKYWNGTAWTAVSGLTDGTAAFTTAAGISSITYTLPTDWAKNTVDSVLGYWIQIEVATYSAVTTQPLLTQAWVIASFADATYTDDTTDLNDAGAGDVALLPVQATVGDGFLIGYSEKFCKVLMTVGTARTGTATLTPKYWDGVSWTTFDTVKDESAGWSSGTGVVQVGFVPPTNWTAFTTANGPGGSAGYFIGMFLTAKTTITAQPLGTIAYVKPVVTGTVGIPVATKGAFTKVACNALAAAGTAADSKFLLINTTTGASVGFTWTKTTAAQVVTLAADGLAVTAGDEIALVQIAEDGSTENAGAAFYLLGP